MSPEQPLGGIFQYHQVQALKTAGLRVGVIAPLGRAVRNIRVFPGVASSINGCVRRAYDNGVPTLRFDGLRWLPGRLPYVVHHHFLSRGLRLFQSYVAEHGLPDLVHAHNALYAGVLAAHIKRRYGIPYVLTEHSSAYLSNGLNRWQVPLALRALDYADALLVVSRYLGETLVEMFGDRWGASLACVPNILDVLFEEHAPVKQGSSIRTRTYRILSIGALTPIKNHASLLRAFAKVSARNADVQLRIGGTGPLRQQLGDLARRLGVEARVQFLGHLEREDVLREMTEANVFVLPSLYETFGVVLIEALATGTPVVATDCGGPREIVNSGNGLLVPPADDEALAQAMLTMADHLDKFDAGQIRSECVQKYGKRAFVERVLRIYNRVLSSPIS